MNMSLFRSYVILSVYHERIKYLEDFGKMKDQSMTCGQKSYIVQFFDK